MRISNKYQKGPDGSWVPVPGKKLVTAVALPDRMAIGSNRVREEKVVSEKMAASTASKMFNTHLKGFVERSAPAVKAYASSIPNKSGTTFGNNY